MKNLLGVLIRAFWQPGLKDRVLGGYKLTALLGGGKYGICMVAEKAGKRYCMKMQYGDPSNGLSFWRRTMKEYGALRKMETSGFTPKPIEMVLTPWVSYLVMELIEGRELSSSQEFTPEEYVRALEAAAPLLGQNSPVWHRDMHLGNMIWGGDKVWLVDWGMSVDQEEVSSADLADHAIRIAQWQCRLDWAKSKV